MKIEATAIKSPRKPRVKSNPEVQVLLFSAAQESISSWLTDYAKAGWDIKPTEISLTGYNTVTFHGIAIRGIK